MSIENPNMHDLETAYYTGLGNIQGGDPEVLEDLGIPVEGETFRSHIASGAEVAELTPQSKELSPADIARAEDHERDRIALGLSQGDADPVYPSPEDKERTNTSIVALKNEQAELELRILLGNGETMPTAMSVVKARREREARQN